MDLKGCQHFVTEGMVEKYECAQHLMDAQVTDNHLKCVSGQKYQHASTEAAYDAAKQEFTENGHIITSRMCVMDSQTVCGSTSQSSELHE
jgi:hypothetical protein